MNEALKLETLHFDPMTKDGDGGDGEIISVASITINSVDNGWIITTTFEDETEITEVYDVSGNDDGNRQAVECVIDSMGLQNDIKIK